MTKAERFAQIAKSYENTPFLDHGREPHKWLDCAGVLVCALAEMGIAHTDIPYDLNAFHNYLQEMENCFAATFVRVETSIFEKGDVLALNFPKIPNHAGVCMSNDYLVHATKPNGVRETSIDYSIRSRVVSVWRLPDAGEAV